MALMSMTGFARESADYDTWTWFWELKSVNAKGLDMRFRLPLGFDGLEAEARARLGKRFNRGNLSAGLMLRRAGTSAGHRINEEQLETVIAAAKDLARRLPDARPPSVDGLLALRGVIEAEDEEISDAARDALQTALLASLERAADSLHAARAEEGGRLASVLDAFIADLGRLREEAVATAETQGDAIRARLKDQIAKVLEESTQFDPGRLEHEAAIIMTKADIREEIDRLESHIESVRDLLAKGGAIGRRLDFLCQELNREANTICSKAHDTALTRIGLDMKATIEQFREQVQNIE